MRKISLFCGTIALIACFDLPIEYYTFLRIAITFGAIAVLIQEMQKDINLLGVAFMAILVFFNPIIPINFYNKSMWIPIDILTGILFLVYGFKEKTSKD